MVPLLSILLLAAAQGTTGQLASERVETAREPEPGFSRLGVQFDAGLPDGVGASAVFRPLRLVNLSAGAITTGLSAGMRGGLHLSPLQGFFRPTIGVDAGRMFEGSTPWVLQAAGLRRYAGYANRTSYDFANLHLGVEVGTRRFSGFVRAGLSRVHARLSDLDPGALDTGGEVSVRGVNLRLQAPSLKLGLVVNLD
jgi:hypothetical protein